MLGRHGGGRVESRLEEFREHLGGRLTVTLLDGIGRPADVHEMDDAIVREAVSSLESFATDPAGPS